MSQLSPRHNAALIVGAATTIVPGMIMAGFMPAWNVLPATSWLAIAAIGSAVAGVISFPRQWLRASVAGAITGSGAFIGLVSYIFLRTQLLNSDTFFHLEFILGMALGAIPGILLFALWVKPSPPNRTQS